MTFITTERFRSSKCKVQCMKFRHLFRYLPLFRLGSVFSDNFEILELHMYINTVSSSVFVILQYKNFTIFKPSVSCCFGFENFKSIVFFRPSFNLLATWIIELPETTVLTFCSLILGWFELYYLWPSQLHELRHSADSLEHFDVQLAFKFKLPTATVWTTLSIRFFKNGKNQFVLLSTSQT